MKSLCQILRMGRIQPQLHLQDLNQLLQKSNERGEVDIDNLKRVVNENTAAIMLNVFLNTLGIFEKNIYGNP